VSAGGVIIVWAVTCVCLYLDGLYDFNKNNYHNRYPYHPHGAGNSRRDNPAAADESAKRDQDG
jgi:hypothetical protein